MGRRTARQVDNRGQKLDRVAQRPAAPGAAVRRYRTDAAAMLREPCRMTDAEAAVLEAARKWIAAKEEMLAADVRLEDPAETQRDYDQAKYDLMSAVYRLLGREPRMPRE